MATPEEGIDAAEAALDSASAMLSLEKGTTAQHEAGTSTQPPSSETANAAAPSESVPTEKKSPPPPQPQPQQQPSPILPQPQPQFQPEPAIELHIQPRQEPQPILPRPPPPPQAPLQEDGQGLTAPPVAAVAVANPTQNAPTLVDIAPRPPVVHTRLSNAVAAAAATPIAATPMPPVQKSPPQPPPEAAKAPELLPQDQAMKYDAANEPEREQQALLVLEQQELAAKSVVAVDGLPAEAKAVPPLAPLPPTAIDNNTNNPPPPMNFARVGGPVPPLSEASKIPFLTEGNPNRLQNAYVHCLPNEIPTELRELDAPAWKDGKFLIRSFLVLNRKSGRRTKSKIQIPHCLLFSAKNLFDRLTVVNFWLSMKKDDQLNMIRNREEGLLKYYMQLKDTRENTFRQAYISGNPLQQLKKKREKQLAELQNPQAPKDVEEPRTIVADEHSTCLDYVLRPSLLCVPCDQFRLRFLPPHHRKDFDRWPLYKERRKQIVADPSINTDQQFNCHQLFDTTKDVGRGYGHKKKRVLDFIEDKRTVQKTQSLLEWEKRRSSKPCFGLSGEGVRALVLQSAEQANRRAILKDEIIPDSFGLPECYHNRTGFENVIIRKEERLIKVYSRNRDRSKLKIAAARKEDSTTGEGEHQENPLLQDKDNMEGQGEAEERDQTEAGANANTETVETTTTNTATAPSGSERMKSPYAANSASAGLSKYHYVIRSTMCARDVDGERAHKLCKACTEAAVMVRSVARDAAKPLNLTKGAALTKLDVAKLVTSPELIETTIRSLRQLRAKDMKLARKELQRLRDRAGIPKQIRRKPNTNTNAAVAAQLLNVEEQLHATNQHLPQHQHQQMVVMPGVRRYEVGNHEENVAHEVYYDSDDPAEPRYGRPGRSPGHTRLLPRGHTAGTSPSKRPRHY